MSATDAIAHARPSRTKAGSSKNDTMSWVGTKNAGLSPSWIRVTTVAATDASTTEVKAGSA